MASLNKQALLKRQDRPAELLPAGRYFINLLFCAFVPLGKA
jgi:hypothetical protein